LAQNIPRTLDNTRVFDSNSYLTADPKDLQAAAERAAAASRALNGEDENIASGSGSEDENDDDESEEEDEEDETMPEAGPSTTKLPTQPPEPIDEEASAIEDQAEESQETADIPSTQSAEAPKILITTSASPCKATYAFCDDLQNVFPGGEFFKRPRGRGYELGRIGRWAAKRGFGAVLVVNEDHKAPSRSRD
jgi:ribosome production factor 1